MIQVPLTANRIAQFAALFESDGSGYLYYGVHRLGGLPVTAQERDAFIAHFAVVLHIGNRIMFGWVICAAIGVAIAELRYNVEVAEWQQALVFLLPLPVIFWSWWHSKHRVFIAIGRRTPLTAPRSYAAAVVSRVVAFPPGLPLLMIAIGTLLLVQLWRYGLKLADVCSEITGVGVIAFGLWIIWFKRRARGG